MSVLPGNPAALAERAESYVRSTALIEQAAQDLRRLALESQGKAVDAVRETSADVASSLAEAHGRYQGTAYALREYAVQLQLAHDRADSAQQARMEAAAATNAADAEASDLRYLRARLVADSAPADQIHRVESSIRHYEIAAGNHADRAAQAQVDLDTACQLLEDAAQRAIVQINTAIAATNDGFLDHLGAFIESVGEAFAAFATWVGEVLATVYDELKRVIMTVIAILSAVVILALVATLLGLIPGIGPLLAGVFVSFAAAFLIASVLSDVLAPTPVVEPYALPADRKLDLIGSQQASLADALDETVIVDKLGVRYTTEKEKVVDDTVIRVTRVVDADGIVRWRVALPSTQEWLSRFNGDQGGTHDLDSNLALMLTPAMQSQYERAVLEAMRQAGVGADDPVMLVGFSQGGIMAGTLAAYNSDYNWSAVVVAGSPIDHMPIPDSVEVVSVQHDWDPVPRLDSAVSFIVGGIPPQRSNWTTIQAASGSADQGLFGIHEATAYSQTLSENVNQVPQETRDTLNRYFVGHDNAYGYQEWYYGWSE